MGKREKSILVLTDDSYLNQHSAKGLRARREVELLKKVYYEVNVLVLSEVKYYRNLPNIDYKIIHIYSSKLDWIIAPFSALKLRNESKSCDFIFSINLNSGWVGFFLSILTGKPLILDYHGVVPEERKYLGGSNLKYRIIKLIEILVLKRAHRVLVVSQNMKNHLIKSLRIDEKKLRVLPNCIEDWFITNIEEVSARRDSAREILGLKEKLVFVYCGSASKWQQIRVMIDLYDQLKSIKGSELHLLIMTRDKEKIEKIINEKKLTDSSTVIKVEHSEVPHILPAGDIGLLLRDDNIVNRAAAPTKTAEYLACGVPILATHGIGNIDEITHKDKICKQITLDFNHNIDELLEYAYDIRINRHDYIKSTNSLAVERFKWDLYKSIIDFT